MQLWIITHVCMILASFKIQYVICTPTILSTPNQVGGGVDRGPSLGSLPLKVKKWVNVKGKERP